MSDYLTVAEVAERLKVSRTVVYELIHRQEIGVYKIGKGAFRISEQGLDEYMKRTFSPAKRQRAF